VLLTEDAPMLETGEPYGDTKIEAERVLQEVGAHGALTWTILRPTVIYGPGDDKFLPKLVENLRSGRARVIGRGKGTVDLLHVDDVVRFVEQLLSDPRATGAILNLSDPDTCSWKELLGVVAGELGVPAPTKHLPYPVALGVAGVMEAVSRVTGKPPRLSRYAVRVVGQQYRYVATRARALGFEASVQVEDGVVACLRA
ncbi:MAG: NAD-dependent epimerase/dehydratase family protein, partial [Myxococcota bacterium]|nr:NAD-dependent epimerase/dehydratase family protein [Myxococcota bacterium]